MNKKNIKENSAAAGGVVGFGGPFTKKVTRRKSKNPTAPFVTETDVKMKVSNTGVVVKDKKKKASDKKNYKQKPVKMYESKSESTLREAIRNLVFLNRVKYHEEQVKREIEEQKVRKIIRYLLSEAKSSQVLLTTGENNAQDFINNILSTTFQQKYAKLSSTKEQRIAFRTVYLTKLKQYLDSLDQQYVLLHPEDKPQGYSPEAPQAGNEPTQAASGAEQAPAVPAIGAVAPPPARRSELKEANGMPKPDTSRIQQQVLATQLNYPSLDQSGVEQAESALVKDMPQIDDLYSMLTFKPLKTPEGEVTSDREMFRKMLFGGTSKSSGQAFKGNLDNQFDMIDQSIVTSDKPTAKPPEPVPAPVPSGTSPGEPTELTPREPELGAEEQGI